MPSSLFIPKFLHSLCHRACVQTELLALCAGSRFMFELMQVIPVTTDNANYFDALGLSATDFPQYRTSNVLPECHSSYHEWYCQPHA